MPTRHSPGAVVAVVVSYNRRELLLEALAAIQSQTEPVEHVIVVDNASDDGAADAARAAAPGAEVIRLPRNVGGAGGFAVGLAHAAARSATWVWLMDDDTIPTPTALAELRGKAEAVPGVAIAGSRVVWTDGRDHPMNTPRAKPFASAAERGEAARNGVLPVRSSSFVSMLVRADAVRRHGLPIADYFIWNDDFEYSTRLLRRARGLFVPSSVVVHKTKVRGSTDADPGDRFFYEVRNKIWMMTRSSSLSAPEKLLYGGSTVLRWIKTVIRSHRRRVLATGFVRGVRAGLHAPRANAVVLSDLGTETDALLLGRGGSDGAAR